MAFVVVSKAQFIAEPELDSVSVNSGITRITWFQHPDPGVIAYIIYVFDFTNENKIDTVFGRTNTQYIDNIRDANTQIYAYKIAAYSANSISNIQDNYHQTIFLTQSINTCNASVSLAWNSYVGWTEGVANYAIFRKMGNGNFIQIAQTSNLNYTDKNLQNNVDYTYYVRAVSNNARTSSSNPVNVKGTFQKTITNICVTGINANIIAWQTDSASVPINYTFQASNDGVNYTNISSFTDTYKITNQKAIAENLGQYTFLRLQGITSCPNDTILSNAVPLIPLSATYPTSTSTVLTWPSSQFPNGQPFEIYKNDTLLTTVTKTRATTSYAIANQILNDCFTVLANATSTCTTLAVISNKVCISPETKILIPDVFNPLSTTPFKPVVIGQLPVKYSFTIFDRYGGKIFETQDINDTWNGTSSGQNPIPDGIYVYLLVATLPDGKIFTQNKTLLILK